MIYDLRTIKLDNPKFPRANVMSPPIAETWRARHGLSS
jgi:hypothetical protein